jgi:protein gp37
MASSIEWLLGGETWNMILARNKETNKVGWFCEKIAPECFHCYAETQNCQCGTNPTRYGNGVRYAADQRDKVEIFLGEKALMKPLGWRDPRLVFPCSMTDIFGNWVTDAMLDQAFAVMALCRQHTFIVLTKRPDLAYWYLSNPKTRERVTLAMLEIAKKFNQSHHHRRISGDDFGFEECPDSSAEQPAYWVKWPLPNVWLLASAGTQKTANEYLPWLEKSPAAVRGVSAEPLLEMVDFSPWLSFLDWGIAGGESGNKARGCNIQWIRSLVMAFRKAGKPLFVKQIGAKPYFRQEYSISEHQEKPGLSLHIEGAQLTQFDLAPEDPKGGDPSEWPPDMRVREYPKLLEVRHA